MFEDTLLILQLDVQLLPMYFGARGKQSLRRHD